MLLTIGEVLGQVERHMDLRLVETHYTGHLKVDQRHSLGGYRCDLYGPFQDKDLPPAQRPDIRIFVVSSETVDSLYLQLLVQDGTDDAFLNSTAFGVEKYNRGPVRVMGQAGRAG